MSSHDMVIYPGISAEELLAYERMQQFNVPPLLAELLLSLNGCKFFELTVYGIPPSMAQEPPLLDRSRRAPLDIASARNWSSNYLAPPAGCTLFASKNVSDTGQVGYFLAPDGGVFASGNGGDLAPAQSGWWPTFREWTEAQFTQP